MGEILVFGDNHQPAVSGMMPNFPVAAGLQSMIHDVTGLMAPLRQPPGQGGRNLGIHEKKHPQATRKTR
jgi:hypothetical protein